MKIAMLLTDNRESSRRYSDPGPDFGPAPRALLEGLANIRDCEVHLVYCTHRPLPCPARLSQNAYYHPLVVSKWGWLRGGYAGCVRTIKAKLDEIKPDVVHAQGTERYCALGAVFSGYPCVLTIHGNMREIARLTGARILSFPWFAAKLEGFVLPRIGGVVCISSYTHRQVSALARRTWLVPNAVEARFFGVKKAPATPPRLLCMANISQRKNQTALVRALEPLAQKREFQLHFYGGAPPQDPYVQEFLELVKDRSWVHFGGLLDQQGVISALSCATALVLPTLEDNCPMTVLEGMAAGLPTAAANVGGVPELIQDDVHGFLFDPHNPENMRAAIAKLLDGNAKLSKLALAARTKALSFFHPDVIAKRHLEIYCEIAGRS